MKNVLVNEETGEVTEVKKEFRSMWYNPFEPVGVDCSNTKEKLYKEIPPYAKDADGKLINDSPEPKFVENGYVDIQERIQSYADECDIYKILERFAASGDESFIQNVQGVYTDITGIPQNLNDFNNLVNDHIEDVMAMPDEVAKAILSDDVATNDVVDMINNYGKVEKKEEEVKKE